MNENCRGCFNLKPTKHLRIYACNNFNTAGRNGCPCRSCLIKSICQLVCDDFKINYRTHYHLQIENEDCGNLKGV